MTKAFSNADPPDADEHAHLAMAADAGSVGLRFGREDGEPVRKRAPLTAVVQSELETFSVHANTAVDEDDRAGLERLIR